MEPLKRATWAILHIHTEAHPSSEFWSVGADRGEIQTLIYLYFDSSSRTGNWASSFGKYITDYIRYVIPDAPSKPGAPPTSALASPFNYKNHSSKYRGLTMQWPSTVSKPLSDAFKASTGRELDLVDEQRMRDSKEEAKAAVKLCMNSCNKGYNDKKDVIKTKISKYQHSKKHPSAGLDETVTPTSGRATSSASRPPAAKRRSLDVSLPDPEG